MKKILLFVLAFTTFVGMLSAQEKLKNESDSLSYALGHSVTEGMKQFLTQKGVLADSASINLKYDEKITKASTEKEKTALDKEKNKALASIEATNKKNLTNFLKGVKASLITENKDQSFNNGLAIGAQLSEISEKFSNEMIGDGGEFNKNAFYNALTESLTDKAPSISNPQELINTVVAKRQEEEEMRKAEELKALHEVQIAKGVKFLAENKTKNGVITLPSGLQYKVIKEGTGEIPTSTDRVTVHYAGRLLDGTEFDSSIKRGEPATFGVTQVIKGWTEALQLMPTGSKWELYIPSELAYAARDQGPIPPFSTLVFEVELLEIEK